MKAELLQRDRMDFDDGAILEMVIWRVPTRSKEALITTSTGSSTATLENALSDTTTSPKGDHRHVGESEDPYVFTDVETLVRDFLADVFRQRSTDEKGNDPYPPRNPNGTERNG
jgi:hypothetical protein